MRLQFEWDAEKAAANAHKHSVGFEEAVILLGDPRTLTIFDEEHSDQGDRDIDLGPSAGGRLLVVVYTERGESIRLIRCRRATRTERRQDKEPDF